MSGPENPWIKWDGGECPVDPDATVQVQFRYEERNEHSMHGPAGALRWAHGGRAGDIIAYRLVCGGVQ